MKTNWQTKKLGEICEKTISPSIVGILGLLFGSLGAIISVLSFTAGDGNQTSAVSGIDYHVALMSNIGFKIGFFFLVLGFVLQVIEKIHEIKRKNVEVGLLGLIYIFAMFLYFFGTKIISRILFL